MNAVRAKKNSVRGRVLSKQEIDALFSFLHKKAENDFLSLMQLNALKNNVVLLLMNQRYPNKTADHLMCLYYDKSYDDVWREYCVQFIGQCYPKQPDPEKKSETNPYFGI